MTQKQKVEIIAWNCKILKKETKKITMAASHRNTLLLHLKKFVEGIELSFGESGFLHLSHKHMGRISEEFGLRSVHCVQHLCLAVVKLLITA